MEFDINKVYTALNAEELKAGSNVALADSLSNLKNDVRNGLFYTLESVRGEDQSERFVRRGGIAFALCYLVSEPQMDWIVYLNRRNTGDYYLTSCRSDMWERVQKDYGAKTKLYSGTDEKCESWYIPRKHLADVIAQWEDGKIIQFLEDSTGSWIVVEEPKWFTDTQYRVKPESLKWTDLKVGDIVKKGNKLSIVDSIISGNTDAHIHIAGSGWADEERLEFWEKV